MWQPDFNVFLKALQGGPTSRPVLYDFLMSEHIAVPLAGEPKAPGNLAKYERNTRAMALMGYDYAPTTAPSFGFPTNANTKKESVSLNGSITIEGWEDFEKYPWQDPDDQIPEFLEDAGKLMPEGMKLFVYGPCGVLENTIRLLSFDNLMYKLYDDPEFVKAVTDAVGSRLLKYYELALQVRDVGIIKCNDDWGFNTQTMMSPEHMREYIFPWHKKAVEAAHATGRPAVLHSCGAHSAVMDDIIDDMGYDGKHSYEDNIQPVEEAYAQYGKRICIMGGMDMDFLCRKTPEEVYDRARAMLLISREHGHYMLGTGNSLASYLPLPQYNAMRQAAYDLEKAW